jgi:hypothetical protein
VEESRSDDARKSGGLCFAANEGCDWRRRQHHAMTEGRYMFRRRPSAGYKTDHAMF